jgi:hypothetical protein
LCQARLVPAGTRDLLDLLGDDQEVERCRLRVCSEAAAAHSCINRSRVVSAKIDAAAIAALRLSPQRRWQRGSTGKLQAGKRADERVQIGAMQDSVLYLTRATARINVDRPTLRAAGERCRSATIARGCEVCLPSALGSRASRRARIRCGRCSRRRVALNAAGPPEHLLVAPLLPATEEVFGNCPHG